MNKKYGIVVLLAAVWSIQFIAVNFMNKQISPFSVGFFVRLATLIALSAIMLASRQWETLFSLKGALPKLLWVGLLGFLLDITSFIGFRYSDANTGTLLLKTDVVMASVISMLVYKERFTKRDGGLIAVMLAGVCLVLGINPFNLHFSPFDTFFILSALFVTLNAFLIKHIHKEYNVNNNVIAYYNNLFTLILFFTSMVLTGNLKDVGFVREQQTVLLLIFLCGITQTLIYLLYYRSLSDLPVWIVKIILLLIPLFTLLFNIILFRQIPTLAHLVGTVLILSSAVGLLYYQQKKFR